MKGLLRRLGETGKTILVSSHILPELSAICDTVGILDGGQLHAFGDVREVMRGIRQARIVEVEFLDDAEGGAEFLRKLGSERGVGDVTLSQKLVRLEWQASDEELTQLLSTLVEKGYKVLGFEEVAVSLEEAFMALTGQKPDEVTPPEMMQEESGAEQAETAEAAEE
jgi:ABC-2 type transport system ATP-binding protein